VSAAAMNKQRDRKNLRTALGVALIAIVSLGYFVYTVWPFG
jgi:hypothetical protein